MQTAKIKAGSGMKGLGGRLEKGNGRQHIAGPKLSACLLPLLFNICGYGIHEWNCDLEMANNASSPGLWENGGSFP